MAVVVPRVSLATGTIVAAMTKMADGDDGDESNVRMRLLNIEQEEAYLFFNATHGFQTVKTNSLQP